MSSVENEATISPEEECLTRHRKEKKELQVEIQRLKHSIPKGDKKKKKDVTAQIAMLEAQLDEKHETELQQLSDNKKVDDLVEQLNNVSTNLNVGDSREPVGKKPSKTQRRKEKKALKQAETDERIRDQETLNESGVRKIEAEKIKKILSARQLQVFEILSDGNCLYAAIVDQLKRQTIQSSVESLRRQAAEYMRSHRDDFLPFLVKEDTGDLYTDEEFETYCDRLATTPEWGGQAELRALSDVLQLPIEVIQADGPIVVIGDHFKNSSITLTYHRHAYGLGEHYNSVMPLVNTTDEDGLS